jgi:hypothetical protein
MCGIITGIARAETTIIEIIMNSFGLSETTLSIIRRGLPTEYTCFLSIFALICLSPNSFYLMPRYNDTQRAQTKIIWSRKLSKHTPRDLPIHYLQSFLRFCTICCLCAVSMLPFFCSRRNFINPYNGSTSRRKF